MPCLRLLIIRKVCRCVESAIYALQYVDFIAAAEALYVCSHAGSIAGTSGCDRAVFEKKYIEKPHSRSLRDFTEYPELLVENRRVRLYGQGFATNFIPEGINERIRRIDFWQSCSTLCADGCSKFSPKKRLCSGGEGRHAVTAAVIDIALDQSYYDGEELKASVEER